MVRKMSTKQHGVRSHVVMQSAVYSQGKGTADCIAPDLCVHGL